MQAEHNISKQKISTDNATATPLNAAHSFHTANAIQKNDRIQKIEKYFRDIGLDPKTVTIKSSNACRTSSFAHYIRVRKPPYNIHPDPIFIHTITLDDALQGNELRAACRHEGTHALYFDAGNYSGGETLNEFAAIEKQPLLYAIELRADQLPALNSSKDANNMLYGSLLPFAKDALKEVSYGRSPICTATPCFNDPLDMPLLDGEQNVPAALTAFRTLAHLSTPNQSHPSCLSRIMGLQRIVTLLKAEDYLKRTTQK